MSFSSDALWDAAHDVANALRNLSPDETRLAVLMALVSLERDGVLVDPATIGFMSPPEVPEEKPQ